MRRIQEVDKGRIDLLILAVSACVGGFFPLTLELLMILFFMIYAADSKTNRLDQ
jgi:hypothetical protein